MSAAEDSALVAELGDLVNRAYATAEAGLWLEGATRTAGDSLVDASGSTDRAASAFCSSTTWLPETWAHPAKQLLGDWYTRLGYHVFRTRDFGCAYPHMAPLLATPCDLVTYRKCTS